MCAHNFELKSLVSYGDGRPPVERAYNKVVAFSKGSNTYRCIYCGGRFTHDSSKFPSFEDWRDRRISKCPQGPKSKGSKVAKKGPKSTKSKGKRK